MDNSTQVPTYHSVLIWTKANRILRTHTTSALEKYGLTMTEWALLGKLYDSEKDGVHLAEIATALSVEPPLVTTMVSSLEKKELLGRKEDMRDRRAKFIFLTEKGQTLVPQVESDVRGVVEKLCQGLSPEQIAIYQKALEIIVKNGSS